MTGTRDGAAMTGTRSFADFRDTGILWAINRQVFHPRGYALAIDFDDAGVALGWMLLGDGSEPWNFEDGAEGGEFAAFAALLRPVDDVGDQTADVAGSTGTAAAPATSHRPQTAHDVALQGPTEDSRGGARICVECGSTEFNCTLLQAGGDSCCDACGHGGAS